MGWSGLRIWRLLTGVIEVAYFVIVLGSVVAFVLGGIVLYNWELSLSGAAIILGVLLLCAVGGILLHKLHFTSAGRRVVRACIVILSALSYLILGDINTNTVVPKRMVETISVGRSRPELDRHVADSVAGGIAAGGIVAGGIV